MRLVFLSVSLLLTMSACTSPDPEPTAESAASEQSPADVTSSAPDTLSMSAGAPLARRPTAPLRIEGACPFECCTYGTWTTTAPTKVFRRAGDTTAVAFTVPAGTRLEALTGHVLLTEIGAAVLRDSVRLYRERGTYRLAPPGDTVLLLDYVGEGAYNAWYADSVYQIGLGAALEQIREPAPQWWARVETADGRTGWLWMDRTPSVRGADACSG